MIEISTFELVLAIGMVIALLISVVAVFYKQGDKAASDKLREFQADRDVIGTLETAYSEYVPEGLVVRFQDGTEFLRMVAKFTVIEADDVAVGILEDIQTPGSSDPSA